MKATSLVQFSLIKKERLLGVALLSGVALLLLLLALQRPTIAEPLDGIGYVDGAQGQDLTGCGNGVGNLACQTVQYAIDHTLYDELWVAAGVYSESLAIEIERALTLRGGCDASFTICNPPVVSLSNPLSYTTVLSGQPALHTVAVTETTVWLDGLTIRGGDDGVNLSAGTVATLTNLTVYGTRDEGIESNGVSLLISNTLISDTLDDGIRVRDAERVTLMGNRVYSVAQDGIQIDDVGIATIQGNVIYATGKDGLKLDGADRATLYANTVHDVNNEGVQIQKGALVTVEANVVYHTGADSILAENQGGTVLIRGNQVYSTTGASEDGIHVRAGVVATVEENRVHDVSDDAIDFKGLSGVVRDNEIWAVGDVGVQVSGTMSISVARNLITDTWDAIYVRAGVTATLEHNVVYSATSDGINFKGASGLIRHNEVHRIGDQGINVNADHTRVISNVVYDTRNEGLRVRSGSVVWIADNLIYDVWGAAQDGIRVEPNVVATILSNTVHHVTDDGITFNGTVGTISGNNLYSNGASGLDVDAETVVVSSNRIFENGGAGIELERAGRFTVSNNLLGENVGGGVWVLGVSTSTGQLVNNTLLGHPLHPVGVGLHVLSHTVTLTSANNIIVSYTTGISVAPGAGVTTTFDDVWHNLVDYEGIASGAGSITQDPMLLDVVGRDYHLDFASPCVDAGWAALAPAFDFEGDARIAPVDIGADELLGISLVKRAPAFVAPGAPITYTLVITNYLDVPATNVVVTDRVPLGAEWVGVWDGGSLWLSGSLGLGSVITWTIPSIAPSGGAARVRFVVTATRTLTNERYRVAGSDQGIGSAMGPPVVTAVLGQRLYLPLALKER
jgi:uncharacterized repeat protein (TIGR01451 family)